jgi:hypothetical protein
VFLFSNGLRILAGVHPGIVLESPDQKTRVLLVQIELSSYSLVHAHKVFSEMSVRT